MADITDLIKLASEGQFETSENAQSAMDNLITLNTLNELQNEGSIEQASVVKDFAGNVMESPLDMLSNPAVMLALTGGRGLNWNQLLKGAGVGKYARKYFEPWKIGRIATKRPTLPPTGVRKPPPSPPKGSLDKKTLKDFIDKVWKTPGGKNPWKNNLRDLIKKISIPQKPGIPAPRIPKPETNRLMENLLLLLYGGVGGHVIPNTERNRAAGKAIAKVLRPDPEDRYPEEIPLEDYIRQNFYEEEAPSSESWI